MFRLAARFPVMSNAAQSPGTIGFWGKGIPPPSSSPYANWQCQFGSASMDLVPTIWVRGGSLSLRQIGSAEDAAALLSDWPLHRRGPFFYLAEQALQGLSEGSIPLEVARLAFESFCREAEILVDQSY